MAPRVKDILNCLNLDAPFCLAESWDNGVMLHYTLKDEIFSLATERERQLELPIESCVGDGRSSADGEPVRQAHRDGRLVER